MKSALCLHGIVGGMRGKNGRGAPVDFAACAEAYKEHIINVNNCDVFIHSWSTQYGKQLTKLYRPKAAVFQPQKIFKFKGIAVERSKKHGGGKPRIVEQRLQSMWYSIQQTLALKKQWEEKNGFKYDKVMTGRLDLLFSIDFDFSKLEPSPFYVSHWNRSIDFKLGPNRGNLTVKSKRYLDLWFLGSSEFMDKLATLYDNFYKYSTYDAHSLVRYHIESFAGPIDEVVKFVLYRWWDYEIYRLKHWNNE